MDFVEEEHSCLTDRPLDNLAQDSLCAKDYAEAMARFIMHASTPVTIGIQGGWGSGKTSLIKVIREKLLSEYPGKNLCVMVNAWEHSLFQNKDSKAEVALSLLNGLSEGVTSEVKASQYLDGAVKSDVLLDSRRVEKAMASLKLGIAFMGRIAAQMVSNMVGGGDISKIRAPSPQQGTQELPMISKEVRELRLGLEQMIGQIRNQGSAVKVIFFIDDLDRIPPATAVEILDITKNIFDLPNCIFVLAIDYEVVVKGLESKFGEKTEKNEREFRQYFDKIIQIPFSMPVGAYGDNIIRLLEEAFRQLGYPEKLYGKGALYSLADYARIATGGNPRSIKRIVNTLSLLRHLPAMESLSTLTTMGSLGDVIRIDTKKEEKSTLETQFLIVALHIYYPEIYRRLVESPDFTCWKPTELDAAWKLNYNDHKATLDALRKTSQYKKVINEPWKEVVYCVCMQNAWLKSQVAKALVLLKLLLAALDPKNRDSSSLSDSSLDTLNELFSKIRFITVDAGSDDESEIDDSSWKNDRVARFARALHFAVSSRFDGIPEPEDESASWFGSREYDIKSRKEAISNLQFRYDKKKKQYTIEVTVTKLAAPEKFQKEVEKGGNAEYTCKCDKSSCAISFTSQIEWEDFVLSSRTLNWSLVAEMAIKAKELCEHVCKVHTSQA